MNLTYVAREFLKSLLEQDSRIINLRNSLSQYRNGFYVELSLQRLKDEIGKWCLDKGYPMKPRELDEICTYIRSITLLSQSAGWNQMIGEEGADRKTMLSLKGSLIDLDKFVKGATDFIVTKNSEYLSAYCLPVEHQSSATCPTWLKFLDEMLPGDVQKVLQEFFGYILWPGRNDFNAFTILYGDGANGKSVVLAALKALIGDGNYTALSIENFNSERTFPLAATYGKLANICEDMEELHKVQEGLIKNYISPGSVITVERKNRDPFEMKPTAKLIFATNFLPRFSDRSDGVWRRLIVLPFKKQILDRSKQRPELATIQFWQQSGELSGLLNWSLDGLARLTSQKTFSESEDLQRVKSAFALECNPAKLWLFDNFEIGTPDPNLTIREVYGLYRSEMNSIERNPIGIGTFNKEVIRTFPSVQKTEHAKQMPDGSRDRLWLGLKRKPLMANSLNLVVVPTNTGTLEVPLFSEHEEARVRLK